MAIETSKARRQAARMAAIYVPNTIGGQTVSFVRDANGFLVSINSEVKKAA